MSSVPWKRRAKGDCAHCGKHRTFVARRLCNSCFVGFNGCDRLDYPRQTWAGPELVEEWHLLARQGHTRRQAAERLGITKDRLQKAIERHVNREDIAS